MSLATPRVYVVGTVGVEVDGVFTGERALPGPQGRLLLALLVVHRHRSLTREEIAAELWPGGPPRSWEGALSALLSKLRPVVARLDCGEGAGERARVGSRDEVAEIGTAFGAHRLRLPVGVWVDLEAAPLRLDQAEAALRDGDLGAAWAGAHTAWSITKRPFLSGEDAPFADEVRDRLLTLRLRALGCLAAVWTERGELTLAEACAEEVVALDPFREDGYRRLMAVHLAGGNPAAALEDYHRCRRLLEAELGARPGAETRRAYEQALAAT